MVESEEIILPSTPTLSRQEAAIHWAQAMTNQAWEITERIHDFTTDQLMDLLTAGQGLERAGWLVRCAASAVLLERAQTVPVRHDGDQTGTGKMALARQLADRTQVSAATVLQDAQLWNTFFTDEAQEEIGDTSHMSEKTYFLAALRADDPIEALKEIAEEKAKNPGFSTTEARRLVATKHAPSLLTIIPSIAADRDVLLAFEQWEQATRRLVAVVGPRGRQIANSQREEWQYELSRPDTSILERIEAFIDEEGVDEIDQVANRLGVDRQVVISWFTRLQVRGLMTMHEKERAPGARGAARKGWQFTSLYYQQKGQPDAEW